jgi:hypothetical protein
MVMANGLMPVPEPSSTYIQDSPTTVALKRLLDEAARYHGVA